MSDGGYCVPFVVTDGTTFRVTPEALEILGKITCPVAPIAVVGKYRTGKSFLLNRLIGHKVRAAHCPRARLLSRCTGFFVSELTVD